MRVRHLIGLTVALVVLAAAILTAGMLVLLGAAGGGAGSNGVRGWALLGAGAVIVLVGASLILSVAAGAGRRARAPRAPERNSPAPPAWAWGMRDGVDPSGGAVAAGETARGRGAPRPVGFSVSRLDVPLIIAGLLLWTGIVIFFFAPHCAAGASTC